MKDRQIGYSEFSPWWSSLRGDSPERWNSALRLYCLYYVLALMATRGTAIAGSHPDNYSFSGSLLEDEGSPNDL